MLLNTAMVAPSRHGEAKIAKVTMKWSMAWGIMVAVHGVVILHGAMAGHGGKSDQAPPLFF